MRRKNIAFETGLWLLFPAVMIGLGVALFGYMILHEYNKGSRGLYRSEQGGMELYDPGRSWHFRYVNGHVTHIIIFDTVIEMATGNAGPDSYKISTANGKKLSMHYTNSEKINIDGVDFDLSHGAVFLVSLKGAKTRCDQLPITFDQPLYHEGWNLDYKVKDLVMASAKEHPGLREFLSMRSSTDRE